MNAEQVAAWASTHPSCTQCGAPVSGGDERADELIAEIKQLSSAVTDLLDLTGVLRPKAQLADELAAALGRLPHGMCVRADCGICGLIARYAALTAPSEATCRCRRFSDTEGYRIADLTCPVHGPNGTDPGDGMWET